MEASRNGNNECPYFRFGIHTTVGTGHLARNSATLATMKGTVDADLAATSGTPTAILINIGSADLSAGIPLQAAWEADLAYVLDAMHTKWTSVPIYVATPWMRAKDADADSLHSWIGNVLVTRAPWAQRGPDERSVIKSDDDGASYTFDGLHYNNAGTTLWAQTWGAVLGY